MLSAAPEPFRPLFLGRGRQGAERLSACCSTGTPPPACDRGQRARGSSNSVFRRAAAAADTSSPAAGEHNARSASTSSRQMQLGAPDTMPPSPGPRPRPRPGSAHSPRGLPGRVVSVQSVRSLKPRPLRGTEPGSSFRGNLCALEAMVCDPLELRKSNSRNHYLVYVGSDT